MGKGYVRFKKLEDLALGPDRPHGISTFQFSVFQVFRSKSAVKKAKPKKGFRVGRQKAVTFAGTNACITSAQFTLRPLWSDKRSQLSGSAAKCP